MRLAILNPRAAFQRRAIVQNENDCIITPDNVDNLPQQLTDSQEPIPISRRPLPRQC